MKTKFIVTTALLTVMSSPLTLADTVYNDDLVVVGNMCTGNDCVNGLAFGTDSFRLRENNTRIRFLDNSAGAVLGQSWMMIANASTNDGNAYFQFQARSVTKDTILFSDGTYPLLDCSGAVSPFFDCITIGLIPAGDPVLVQESELPFTNTVTTPWYTLNPVLYLGTANNIAIGGDSEVVNAAVSIGKTGLERKLIHVAKAIAATDLATVADIEEMTDKLDLIDTQLDEIERAINVLDGTSLPGSSSSAVTPYTLILLLSILLYRINRQLQNEKYQ